MTQFDAAVLLAAFIANFTWLYNLKQWWFSE